MNWQSQCGALQTVLFSPTGPKGGRWRERRGKVQEINLKMLNHFTLFLHFPMSFDLSAN